MSLPRQATRFAAVGGLATAVHVGVGLLLAERLGVPPFWANLCAFATAVAVSYVGNLVWTFGAGAAGLGPFPRFLLVALAGLALNQAIVFAAVDLAGWPYRAALLCVVLLVPALTFLSNRHWVFKAAGTRRAV